MRDRLTTKDALVFIALSQQDLAGIYWMIWEPMMMSGVKAFQYLLDGIEHRTGQAALPHPACMGLSLSREHHAIFVVL